MMTKEQYIESLRKLNLKVYFMGELISNPVDHPMIRPSMNSVAMTYELAEKDEYKTLMTAKSNLTGKTVNRFCHLHQSTEDLINKVKMQRLVGQKTGACFQRCVGMDAFNAIYSTTYEIDQAHGTEYHKRFTEYLKYVQDNDLTVDGAKTGGFLHHNKKILTYIFASRRCAQMGLSFAGPKLTKPGQSIPTNT
jgi:4-hydroxybutyryl-CoA dehydratase/vinylacetyl-CoA-Delta-isomerase